MRNNPNTIFVGLGLHVIKKEGQPAHMEIEHMDLCMNIDTPIDSDKSEFKKGNPLVHISVRTSPVLMSPLAAPSVHIYLLACPL